MAMQIEVTFLNELYRMQSFPCYSVAFLAANIGALFLIAIIQAFTTKKEADWMERVSGHDKIG